MSHFEANKIAASVLTAALIALLCAQASRVLYRPRDLAPDERGFTVAAETGGVKEEGPVLTFPQLLAAGSAENGAKIFKKCASCHDNSEGGPNKVGPNLWGIVGAKRARNATFAYSEGMKAKGGEWTYEEFQKFLKGPQAYINGTKMTFAGLKKEKDVADVVLFLRQNGSKDYPLPAADAPAAAEAPKEADKAKDAVKPAEAPKAAEPAPAAEAAPKAAEPAPAAEAAPKAAEPSAAVPEAPKAAEPAPAAEAPKAAEPAEAAPNVAEPEAAPNATESAPPPASR